MGEVAEAVWALGEVAASRTVLRRVGNLSSATILFVLDELVRSMRGPQALGVLMAFGPGLVIEMARGAVMSTDTARGRETEPERAGHGSAS